VVVAAEDPPGPARKERMPVHCGEFSLETRGHCDLHDVTPQVQRCIDESGMFAGIVCVAVAGSTAAVSTLEFEPGLLQDVPALMEKIIPSDRPYEHDNTWHDGNGFSHLRSFMVKTSHTVPFNDGKLVLGTWQQIVLADFDNRSRSRRVIVQLVGE
jgi:secondary thiamine-phosphate synthase enzyme